jgi:hypothetical protein
MIGRIQGILLEGLVSTRAGLGYQSENIQKKSHILFTGGPAEYEEANRDANGSHRTWQDLLFVFDDFVVRLFSGHMGLEIEMDPEHVRADGDDSADENAKEGH